MSLRTRLNALEKRLTRARENAVHTVHVLVIVVPSRAEVLALQEAGILDQPPIQLQPGPIRLVVSTSFDRIEKGRQPEPEPGISDRREEGRPLPVPPENAPLIHQDATL
jgi:hypothetical protein